MPNNFKKEAGLPRGEAGSIGAISLLVLVAALGILGFLLISNTFEFKDRFFARLFPKPPSHAQEIQNLRELTNELLRAPKKEEQKLIEIASKRKELMKKISASPDAFILNALPKKVVNKFPKKVQDLLEKQVKVEGTVAVTIFDDFENGTSFTKYSLNNYTLYFAKGHPSDLGDKIIVSGFALDENLVVDVSSKKNIITLASPSVAAAQTQQTPVERKIAVVPFNFTDDLRTKDYRPIFDKDGNFLHDEGQEITVNNLTTNFFAEPPTPSVRSAYQDNSFGKLNFSGKVYEWKTIPYNVKSTNLCEYEKWADMADEANSINEDDYHYRFYIFPRQEACKKVSDPSKTRDGWAFTRWRGQEIIYRRAWSNGLNDRFVFAHELGHNLGLDHAHACDSVANLTDCKDLSANPPKYKGQEDIYSLMGKKAGDSNDKKLPYEFLQHFNAPQKIALSWLLDRRVKNIQESDVDTVKKSGTFNVAPLELKDSTIPQVLKIIHQGKTYYVEYRQQIGFDNVLFMSEITGGVSVHSWDASNHPIKNPTFLIRLPEISQIFSQRLEKNITAVALKNKESFFDEVNGIKVKQLSHDSTKASVEVTFGPGQCAEHEPSVGVTFDDNSTYSGGVLAYTVSVTNHDSSACPARVFILSQVVPTGWNGTFSPSSLTLSPGQTGTSILWTVDSADGAIEGVYDVIVTAASFENPALNDSETTTFIIDSPPPTPSPTPSPTASPDQSPTPPPTSSPTPSPTPIDDQCTDRLWCSSTWLVEEKRTWDGTKCVSEFKTILGSVGSCSCPDGSSVCIIPPGILN